MKQFVVFFFLILLPLQTMAQRRITVVDMDTSLPVKGVSVKVGGGQISVTDHAGHVDIPIVFESIVFSHIMYEPEHLTMTEVGDTMFLLPKNHLLPEVTVTELDPRIKGLISGWVRQGAMRGAAEVPRATVSYSFDFADMLDRRGRRDRKHLERARKVLKEWDKKQ